MNTNNFLAQNDKKIDNQMYKICKIAGVLFTVDFIFFLTQKSLFKFSAYDITFFLSFFIILIPISYYKFSQDKKGFKRVTIYSLNTICLVTYLITWTSVSFALLIPMGVACLYYDYKLARNLLVFDTIVMIILNFCQPFIDTGNLLDNSVKSALMISAYYTIQLIMLGMLFISNCKNSSNLLIKAHNLNTDISSILNNSNNLAKQLSDSVNTLNCSVSESNLALEESNEFITKVNSNLDNMINSISSTDNSINEIITHIGTTLEKTTDIYNHNERITAITNKSKDNLSNVMSELSTIKESTNDSKTKVMSLEEKTKEILNAVTIINGLAEQTTLLSLNASIEAVRAGEAGKGFMVVASEIKNLSLSSNKAADDIKNMLSDVNDYTTRVVDAIDSTSAIVDTNIKSISDSYSDFDEVFTMQSSMVHHIKDINSLMSVLHNQGDAIKSNMNHLKSINESTNLSIDTMTSNLEELQSEFNEISTQVNSIQNISHNLVENT